MVLSHSFPQNSTMYDEEYLFLSDGYTDIEKLFHKGGTQTQLSSTPHKYMELLATGCNVFLQSLAEQLFSMLHFKQITLKLLHLQLFGKIQ